jgi:hypothetical protein
LTDTFGVDGGWPFNLVLGGLGSPYLFSIAFVFFKPHRVACEVSLNIFII